MRRALAGVVLSLLGSVAVLADEAAVETKAFSLQRIMTKDALTVLRTILELKQFAVVDDANFEVTAPADRLEMATQILDLVDTPQAATEVSTIADGPDFTIAVAPLRGTPPGEAMRAMRELRVHKIALISLQDLVVIRDNEAKVKAALQRLESLGEARLDRSE